MKDNTVKAQDIEIYLDNINIYADEYINTVLCISPDNENYKKERRVFRGLFVSNDGKKINADVNGAYQIMKKVIPDAFSKGIEGAGLHPTIINLDCSR